MKLAVIKRMAKGSVEPLFWVATFIAAVFGTSALIGNFTEYTTKEAYPFVWAAFSLGVLAYWAYGWTKWNMEWEQRQVERELKYTKETQTDSWEFTVAK